MMNYSWDRSQTLNRLRYCAALGFDTGIAMSALELGVFGASLQDPGSVQRASGAIRYRGGRVA